MSANHLHVTLLGTGTSMGVPTVGCSCAVCKSNNPKNKRLRAAVWLSYDNFDVLIDTGPDLRQQALTYDIKKIDAVLLTHAHADHLHGIDDIRPFNWVKKGALDFYANAATLERVRGSFPYIFTNHNLVGGIPMINLREIAGPFELGGRQVTPLPVGHGSWTIYGFRIGNFAYITDVNHISQTTRELMRGLDVLVLDALRPQPHPTHFCLEESVAVARDLAPKHTFFTHLGHEMDYDYINSTLPGGMQLAHDGQTFEIAW